MLRRSLLRWQTEKYDVCVIGGGPAGVAAALRAEQFGKSVCLVEKNQIGGADLWDGALQSKTMWEMAKFYDRIKIFGPKMYKTACLETLQVDEAMMHRSLLDASLTRQNQIKHALAESGVTVVHGTGEFQSPNLIHVHQQKDVAARPIQSDYFVIATGSVPRVHPQYAANGTTIQTSDHIMRTALPESMVIIGAGVIGCEFASIAANLGKTKVSIIEKSRRMLPMEDEDVASYVEGLLAKKGVIFHHNAALDKLESLEEGTPNAHVRYTVKNNKTGEKDSFDVQRALISIGRVPQYSGLGIEKANCGVKNGRLVVDEYGRCLPNKHIYAVGDATVDIALVNMGECEAIAVVDHIYRPRREATPDVKNLSTIMFLDQEVAAVGLSEQQCKEKNIAYIAARYGYDFVTRAVCMGSAEGFVKILVTNDRQKTVLGVRAVGAHASSIVELASLAIHNQQSVYDMGEMLPAYPAMTQGFQECLRVLVNKSILKPNVFPQVRLWRWSPGNFERGRAYASQ